MIHIEQKRWTQEKGMETLSKEALAADPQLVMVFGSSALVTQERTFTDMRTAYPHSHILMLSTAGEIADTSVSDNTLSVVALAFEKTTLAFAEGVMNETTDSAGVGKSLAETLPKDGLVHVLVFSDGLKVNGTDLVKGMASALPPSVAITGGMVGDGVDFKHTYIGFDAFPQEGRVVAIGLYGSSLNVGYGSRGGWDVFGPERTVTRAKGNVLYELDGQPALTLYKEYLGEEKAKQLPSSGLLFPLSLRLKGDNGSDAQVVRTLLSVNEEEKSITFAGTIPQGVTAQLMRANFDRLVTGAADVAGAITSTIPEKPQFALLISCVGRKLVLQERIEEEVEAIRDAFGADAVLAGFYSYGEISPITPTEKQCQLHNQTMTITTLTEL